MSHLREDLAKIGQETRSILERGSYTIGTKTVSIKAETEQACKNAVLYKPTDLSEIFTPTAKIVTHIATTDETTLAAARRLKQESADKVIALNFASARYPGGGWLTGAPAQEESLARASALYPTINQFQEMYKFNNSQHTALYSNYMIYSPAVPVFRDDSGKLLDETCQVSFITSPAPNAGAVIKNEPQNRGKIDGMMRGRIEKILKLAALQGYDTLVLGAFGCGVFQNNPIRVAYQFRELLNSAFFKGQFNEVIFAVYDKSPDKATFKAFKSILG